MFSLIKDYTNYSLILYLRCISDHIYLLISKWYSLFLFTYIHHCYIGSSY